jgi:hypothetical protein
VKRRQPFGGTLSRAVLALLSGPSYPDRRVLGRPFSDEELAGVDPAAPGWVAPVPADELAGRRRRPQRVVAPARRDRRQAARE